MATQARARRVVESAASDLRYAVRTCRRAPGFTFVAVLTLAIGIAANTAVFSLLNAVVLRPLPFPDSSRIVLFLTSGPEGFYASASDARFNGWRTLSSTFDDVSAFDFPSMLLRSGDHFDDVIAGQVTGDFFHLLGAQLEAGRFFTSQEERSGGDRVAVISDAMWRRRFQSGHVIGTTLELDHEPYVIIGILRPGFHSQTFTTARYEDAEVWLPLPIDPASTDFVNRFAVAARLRSSVSLGEAQARVASVAADLHRRFPAVVRSVDSETVQPLHTLLGRRDRAALVMLSGAVCLVLLIACANVASLLLARGTARAPETAIRLALGAGRKRIVQQLMTENIALATIAAAIGFAGGRAAIDGVVGWIGPTITRIGVDAAGVPMDVRVFGFTCATAFAAVMMFGLAPALTASRLDPTRRVSEQSGRHTRIRRYGSLLSAGEIAAAIVLLITATLFIRSYMQLESVRPGFDPHNLLAVQVTADAHDIKTSEETETLARTQERVRALPGVTNVTAAMIVPFDPDSAASLRYIIEGRPLDGPYHGVGLWRPIATGYFETLGIPLVRGRTFSARDSDRAPPVAIINQAMAQQWWPHGDAIGHSILLGKGTGWDEPPREIVGIVSDVRDQSLDQGAVPTNYVPIAQLPDRVAASALGKVTWIVRTQATSDALQRRIQQVVQRSNNGLPTKSLGEVSGLIGHSTLRAGLGMWLMAVFAGVAVLLAAIGVYGVLSYAIRQRTREIGIRIAVGGDPGTVVRLLVIGSLRYSLAGLAVGVLVAAVAARLLHAFVFGIAPRDPLSFAAASAVVVCVAVAAAWLPARRAARIDPIVALRAE